GAQRDGRSDVEAEEPIGEILRTAGLAVVELHAEVELLFHQLEARVEAERELVDVGPFDEVLGDHSRAFELDALRADAETDAVQQDVAGGVVLIAEQELQAVQVNPSAALLRLFPRQRSGTGGLARRRRVLVLARRAE